MQATVVDKSQMVGANSSNSLKLVLQRMAGRATARTSADVPVTAEDASALGIPVKGATTKKK